MDDDERQNIGKIRAADLRAAGIHSLEDLIVRAETQPRGDTWIFISFDRTEDGNLRPINATGFFSDQAAAFLGAETHKREWAEWAGEDDAPIECIPIPLFEDNPRG